MTDKHPRGKSGDGDGPAETATERLLREAMTARTSLITAHDLRPAAPPKSRIRRLRPVYAVTVPLLGLAAAAAIGVVTLHGSPVANHEVPPPAATVTTSPSPTPEPAVTPTPSATPTDTGSGTPTDAPETEVPLADSTPSSSASATNTVPAGGPSTSYTFRGVKLKIPAGWRAVTVPNTYHLCILSPGAPQDADAQICEPYGVDLFVYDQEPDLWPSVSFLDDNAGWTSQPYCPVWGNPHDAAAGEITSVGPTKSTPTVSGRPARKSQWQVTCGKSPFTAQMWALPKDHVFVSAIGLKADYQAGLQSIVNSLDVSGHKVAGATPSGVAASAGDIAVTVNGLGAGQPVSTNGTPVTFTVTYRNTSRTDYPAVQPLVFTDVYPGTPDGQIPMNAGKLERQDNGNWVQAILSPGGGMDYAMSGKEAAFPLAPGASRTVTYRMTLTPADGPGSMPLRAKATLPYDGSSTWTQLGGANVQVTVVK